MKKLLAPAIAVLLALLAACASPPDEARVVVAPLDEEAYGALVHPVVVESCGPADCHGKLPRGLRVYGSGLRLPGDAGAASSPAEIRATYESILGLEPEKMNAFTSAEPRSPDRAYELLVLAKPLATERHRGGVSLRKGEPAEQCIFSWLMGSTDAAACTR